MTSLAVAWTRPETAREDAARVLAMSGLAALSGGELAVLGGGLAAPWLYAAVSAALAADPDDPPASRITPQTRTVLHLLAAATSPALGVDGCLRALAATSPGDAREERTAAAERVVADARAALAADVAHHFLVDATLVPDGTRPDAPPRAGNLLLAGRDPVAVDAAIARVLGLDPRTLPVLAQAERAALGVVAPDPQAAVGDLEELDRRSPAPWRPRPRHALVRLTRRTLRWLGGGHRRDGAADTPWHALRRAHASGAADGPRAREEA
jgi:hypothetical protein